METIVREVAGNEAAVEGFHESLAVRDLAQKWCVLTVSVASETIDVDMQSAAGSSAHETLEA